MGRYYVQVIGRWNGRDPKGFSARDSNLLRYVWNNAPNAADPTSLAPQPCTWMEIKVRPEVLWGTNPNVWDDIAQANEVFKQCCIRVINTGAEVWSEDRTVAAIGKNLFLHTWIRGQDADAGSVTEEEKAMTKDQINDGYIYVYYVRGFEDSPNRKGQAYPHPPWSAPPWPAVVLRNDAGRKPATSRNIFSHELGHILLASGDHVPPGRYRDAEPNLMAGGDPLASWRLDREQCDKMRENTALVKASLAPR